MVTSLKQPYLQKCSSKAFPFFFWKKEKTRRDKTRPKNNHFPNCPSYHIQAGKGGEATPLGWGKLRPSLLGPGPGQQTCPCKSRPMQGPGAAGGAAGPQPHTPAQSHQMLPWVPSVSGHCGLARQASVITLLLLTEELTVWSIEATCRSPHSCHSGQDLDVAWEFCKTPSTGSDPGLAGSSLERR